eukprot:88529-Alexandrium_andersonii.AAC.1
MGLPWRVRRAEGGGGDSFRPSPSSRVEGLRGLARPERACALLGPRPRRARSASPPDSTSPAVTSPQESRTVPEETQHRALLGSGFFGPIGASWLEDLLGL